MADIFISYKSEDKEIAKKVDELVRSVGYSTWWDTSLVAGNRYNDEIDKQLQLAKVTIVIWSERSWNSTWVKEEALFSRDQDKLLPIKIDGVKIGVPFYSLQTLDFINWEGDSKASNSLKLLESLERYLPRKLRSDYSINVYWTKFNDKYVEDEADVSRFLDRVVNICLSIGIKLNLIKAWDHIVNPSLISDRSVYEKDLNILLFFGKINLDGFAEDVFCPGLRQLARGLNPYTLHIGHEDFSLDFLNFYCLPQRKVETLIEKLPKPDTILGDSAVEALSSYIAFRVIKTQRNIKIYQEQTT